MQSLSRVKPRWTTVWLFKGQIKSFYFWNSQAYAVGGSIPIDMAVSCYLVVFGWQADCNWGLFYLRSLTDYFLLRWTPSLKTAQWSLRRRCVSQIRTISCEYGNAPQIPPFLIHDMQNQCKWQVLFLRKCFDSESKSCGWLPSVKIMIISAFFLI